MDHHSKGRVNPDADMVGRAAGFAAEIRERAADIEAARRMPEDLAARMAAAGLFRSLVPARYGGGQIHPREFFDAVMTTAEADGSVGWCLMIGASTGLLAATLADEAAEALFAANPDAIVTGVTAPIGKAEVVPGGVRVSGRWPFGSASQVSQWICGGSVVLENGEPRQAAQGGPEVILPLFEASEVRIHDSWHTSGLCGTGSNDIEVRDAFVPEGRWVPLGAPPRVDAPLYRFPFFGLLALGVSAVCLGLARHAIGAFTGLAGGKRPTGSRRTLAQRGSTQQDLARAEALVASGQALTYQAIDRAWQQAERAGRLDRDIKAQLRLAATNNAWSAAEAVDRLYHAAGGTSIYRSNVLQRCFRDVHVATQHLMVAQPTYEVVGRVMLGMDPKTPL
ncbi:MAG: acyl-CoA dehydrogenase family protein [Gammaproteobacteria bacterium]|nr:acyl-CoA dehydrogenase family protein [Gammaproteobacteria bacterium]